LPSAYYTLAIARAEELGGKVGAVIGKPEIIRLARQLRLNPHVVEKDYALGWVLAGIFANDRLAESWIFKGGTCLKKCFFETYRFSEDLDFTLQDESHLDRTFLEQAFAEIGAWIYERSGLEFPANQQGFDIYDNPHGHRYCLGRIGYRGPVSPTSGGWPRIKLDLTADERLVLPPVRLPIFHPYSDTPDGGIVVRAYAYEEAFGEKVRALAERMRPRDLYDVINLYRNAEPRPSPSVLLDVLAQKCEFKGIAIPKAGDLEPFRNELESAWEHMLRHQLPALPPVESFWNELPTFFDWLESGRTSEIPASYARAPGETILRERTFHLPIRRALQAHVEVIRFAAANYLCVDLDYLGSTRRIEPYSLRRTQEGNVILHAWNVDKDTHRSYRVDRIEGARTTTRAFTPRYAVELTPSGPVSVPPTERPSSDSSGVSGLQSSRTPRRRTHRTRSRSVGSSSLGPTYVYECPYCRKKFRHRKPSTRLNPHKTRDGWPCPGRVGYLVDTR
jgi:predicted nucleotidyltransferase component of viral defense system